MRKARQSGSSSWTSDYNENDVEMGSRTTLIERKNKKKKQSDQTASNSTSIDKPEPLFKVVNSESSPGRHIVNDNSNEKEGTERFSTAPRRRDGKSTIHQRSSDLEEATGSTNPIDVIADVHNEFKETKAAHRNENVLPVPKSRKTGKKCLEESEDKKSSNEISSKKSKNPQGTSRLQKLHDDAKAIDSLDLIEEYQESSSKRNSERILKTKTIGASTEDDIFNEKQPRSRRQWDAPDRVAQLEDLKKPPRKRWSKDTSVIRLPEVRSVSSTASSVENVSSLASERVVPLTRSSLTQGSVFGFDNASFVSDNEEVLQIETGYDEEKPKIRMRRVTDRLDDTGGSSTSDQSHRETLDETVIAMDHSSESEEEPQNRYFIKRKETTILDIENSGHSEKEELSPSKRSTRRSASKKKAIGRGKQITENSGVSESLDEVGKRSDSSSDRFTKSSLSSKNRRMNNSLKSQRIQSLTYSSQDTLTSDEDSEDDEHLERSQLESRSTKPSKKSRKPSLEEKENHLQKKAKKKDVRGERTMSSGRTQESGVDEVDPKKTKRKRKKKEEQQKNVKYISLTVHRADMIETDYVTKHPMVKVHIVEAETGKYLKRARGESGSAYLQPIITGKFDFRENRSLVPVWEEELIFEHDFDALLKTDKEQVVILFEIIDLLTFAEASFNYDRFGHEGCWYKVAWAFLKPVGKSNTLHINKKVRLQLYRFQRRSKKYERHTCEVYSWWRSNNREKYPSSLFVTITAVDPPKLEPVFYQQLSLYDLSDARSESRKTSTRTSDSVSLPKWTRLAAQSCKIPNKMIFETEISENGCFFVAFSNDGKHLACVFSEEYDYPIIVYEVETKKIHVRFSGHKTFVYSLNWSTNDTHLLSVSSDQTARIWDTQNQIMQHVEMMPHPSYVYCGKFEPETATIVATGCYDRVTRIWVKNKKSKNRDLSQELEGHDGFVNSMCFQKNGNLLTADSVGLIIIWVVKKNRKLLSRKEWHISRKIKVRDIEGIIINTIILHPLESRLLVHSRNNGLRMLDLATGVVLQKYTELNNQRIQCAACISPCGGLILCGGEDSSLNLWNLETGKYLAKYTVERNFRAVTCVDYHPYDHVLAYSTFGSPAPVRILQFDKDSTGEDVGLKIMEETDDRVRSGDISMRVLNLSIPTRERSRSTSRKCTPGELSNERDSHNDRSHKHFSREVARNHTETTDEKYGNAKLKLQRLNETEQTLKSRSASRLYNIIEKIDRILSNTSRSSDDLESGRNSALAQGRKEDKLLMRERESRGTVENKSGKSKSSTYSHIEDHSGSYFESTTSSAKNEIIAFKNLKDAEERDLVVHKKRSKSAKELRRKKAVEDDTSKTFSDSAMTSRKLQVYDEIMETMQHEHVESSFIVQSMGENNRSPNVRALHGKNSFTTDSSPSSVGTYVVEKADVEKNSDRISEKKPEYATALRTDGRNDLIAVKVSESESSVRSNATFVIENEVPIPKPRRKRNVV